MSNIRFNLFDALQENPDRYAENAHVGRSIGLPGGLVNEDDRRAFRARLVEENIKMLPVSGRLYGTREGAILAQDDAEQVATIERATAARKLEQARKKGEVYQRRMTDPGLFMENSGVAWAEARGAVNNRDLDKAASAQIGLDKAKAQGDDRLNFEIQVWEEEIAREGGLDRLPAYRQEQYLALKERQKTAGQALQEQLIAERNAKIDDWLADWAATVPRLSLETEQQLAQFSQLQGWAKVKYFTNPRVALHTLSSSMGRAAPAIAAGAAAAAATTATGGTAGVAALASMAASSKVSYDTERASHLSQRVQQLMAERGGDLTREDVIAVFEGSDLQEIADEADSRALPIAALDALSMGTASWLYRWGKQAGRTGAAMTASMGASAAYGATGEALAQKMSTGEVQDWADVAIEGVAEFLFGGLEFGSAAIGYGVRRLQQHHEGRVQNFTAATQAAQQSKLRGRAPDVFYQLSEELEEFADHPHIYVDGNALADSGLMDALLQAAPEYGDAVQQAINTGGSVQIRMADVLAKISADAKLSADIREHVRFEPDGLSMRELQQNAQAELRDAVEKAVVAQENKEAREAEVQMLREGFVAQLDAASAFTRDANRQNAELPTAFYSQLANNLNITPQEALQQHPLHVVAGTGKGYEQALAEHPPRGWQHVETGEEIGQLWRGESEAQAVFWTENTGKFAEEFPEMATYSHSIGKSAMDHIRKGHGDAVLEARRGQVGITEEDIAKIPDIIRNYDAVRTDLLSPQGSPRLMFAKKTDDGTIVYMAQPSRKKKDLQGVTMWKYPPAIDEQRALEIAITSNQTFETEGGISHTDIRAFPSTSNTENDSSLLSTSETEAGISQTSVADHDSTAQDGGQGTLYQESQSALGTYDPQTATIALTPKANLSTFIHEFGHHALETLVNVSHRLVAKAESETLTTGEQKVLRDTQALLASVGFDLETWRALSFEEKRPHHETVARTFETYIMTGKAPSLELQSAFARFKAWLFALYKNLRKLDAPLSDEVKQVFDRMLASDEAIEQMRQMRGLTPMYATAEEAGMTEEEFAEYQENWQQAGEASRAEMEERNRHDLQYIRSFRNRHLRRMQAEARETRKQVEAEAREQLQSLPVYRAEALLKQAADGDTPPVRLSRDALRELGFSEVETKALGRKVSKHGMHPDELASILFDDNGEAFYPSGDALVRDLLAAAPFNDAVKELTDRMMLEMFGELSSPAAIAEAADMAAHNEFTQRAIVREANALAEAVGKPSLLASAARALAREMMADKRLKDVKPHQFTRMAVRAGKAAEAARKKGDIETAAAEKQHQALQMALAREAWETQESAAKQVRYLKRMGRLDPKSIMPEHREQIEGILERYDLRTPESQRASRKKSLAQWVAEREALGYEPDLADFVLDETARTPWQNLKVSELRGLVDSIKQIEHAGKQENRLLKDAKNRDMKEVLVAMEAEVGANAPGGERDNRTPTHATGKILSGLHGFLVNHYRASHQLDRLAGGNAVSTIKETLLYTANACGDLQTEMRGDATEAINKILAPVLAQRSAGIRRTYHIGGKDRAFSKRNIFVMALNWGNEGNRQRLLDGEGWTEAEVKDILFPQLTGEDWDAVQAVWDYYAKHTKPKIAGIALRVDGKEPDWVEASPFTQRTADGKEVQLRGGYYPVVYDPQASPTVQDQQAKDIREGHSARAAVRDGFTKSRAEAVKGRPLLYDFSGIYRGLDDTIHYIAWREWVIDSNRLLGDNGFTRAILKYYGADFLKALKDWRNDIASNDRQNFEGGVQFFATVRQNVALANLSFSAFTAVAQIFGLFQSMVRVGYGAIAISTLRYMGSPLQMNREAVELSSLMKNRAKTRFRELNELRSVLGEKGKVRDVIGKYGFWGLMQMQRIVDTITWHAELQKSLQAGVALEEAVKHADQAVIDSQGSGMTKDLSAVERGSELKKWFTLHYSFMNTILNLNVNTLRSSQKSTMRKMLDLSTTSIVMVLAEAALRAWLTPGDAEEWEEDKLWETAAKKVGGGLMGQFIGVREFTGMIEGYDYKGPIGASPIANTYAFFKQVGQGEMDDALLRAAVNMGGSAFGLPAAQINRTIKGAEALADDKTDNPLALAFGYQE